MTTETPRPSVETGIMEVRREDFGPGAAGEWSYQTIVAGARCVTYVEDKTECGQKAKGTVDVDIRGDLDIFPYCSDEHATKLTDQLVKEIEKNGGMTVPSRNGFGRA